VEAVSSSDGRSSDEGNAVNLFIGKEAAGEIKEGRPSIIDWALDAEGSRIDEGSEDRWATAGFAE
jgi:hypothetical protein